ncbi:MAG: GNAT family N-acetyltransferase [Acholeplasma sp.]|jgi:ribosomal protein S18 acetylase RimI-like enzyme|nr:MAG: GNAT family N-acetyltransferase [Acholeplasma sp.]
MKPIIRQMNENDVKQYRLLRLEALKNHPEAFASSYEEEILYDESIYVQRLKQQSTYSVGAFDGDAMIGMAVFVPQSRTKISHMADIFSVYVSPLYRKHNLGYLMIQTIINHAKQLGFIEQIKLSVTSTNLDAIKLYMRCGFEIYGTDPHVIKVGDRYYDSTLMILYIK